MSFIYTYIAKARLSFCAHTHLCDAVNQSVSIFWLIYMHHNHIYCKDMTQSLLIYTERQQRLCACAATHIRHIHIYTAKTQLSFCAHTHLCNAVNRSISIFWSIYMRRKYIDQSSSSSFSWVIIQRTWKFTLKWSAFLYINQSLLSSLSLMIIQTSWKLTSKWSAFTILNCLCDHWIIYTVHALLCIIYRCVCSMKWYTAAIMTRLHVT